VGLFDLFGTAKNTTSGKIEKQLPWNKLVRLEQLPEIVEESKTVPVLIFKHSTRCGISRMVFKSFEKNFELNPGALKMYYLDLLSFRDVSDEVGYRFQILHQSPQVIVIKNGVVVAHASHYDIQLISLEQFV
jgi:bacillithiol system protein YtxJ